VTCLGKQHMGHDMQRTPSTWLVELGDCLLAGRRETRGRFRNLDCRPQHRAGAVPHESVVCLFPARARRERTINNGRPSVREMCETDQARIPRASVINVTR